jgi:hypothetical protein
MTHAMNCTAFDDRLADYLEDDLGPVELQAVQGHLASCVRCTAIVRDLQRIRADADELAELTPSRDLWAGIAERIDAPVVPLAPRAAPSVVAAYRGTTRLRLAAIAAALVAVTAGVTYTLTVSRGADRSNDVAAIVPDRRSDSVVAPNDVARADATPQTLADSGRATTSQSPPTDRAAAGSAQNVGNASPTATYSREIDRLRDVFARNRSQLDPRTAAIIEANLKVIDEAIAASRAALEQDPASRFLNNKLNSALDKKLELLRTAALLPNRT